MKFTNFVTVIEIVYIYVYIIFLKGNFFRKIKFKYTIFHFIKTFI